MVNLKETKKKKKKKDLRASKNARIRINLKKSRFVCLVVIVALVVGKKRRKRRNKKKTKISKYFKSNPLAENIKKFQNKNAYNNFRANLYASSSQLILHSTNELLKVVASSFSSSTTTTTFVFLILGSK